jgi:glutamine amidotransferase
MTEKTLLVDAGTGNLRSVYNALQAAGYSIRITSNPDDLAGAGRVILPGVGAFASFMDGLHEHGLAEPLRELVLRGIPLLGICVGMQALFEQSEENGIHAGLGLLSGQVKRFPPLDGYKIPHTGWNQLWPEPDGLLFKGIAAGAYAYFNHTYYCETAVSLQIGCSTDYGLQFASAICCGNLYGVQFHPEKSQQVGRRLLQNFMDITL